jgi:hypothetical protein
LGKAKIIVFEYCAFSEYVLNILKCGDFIPLLIYLITWKSQMRGFQVTPKNYAPFCAP